MRRFVALSDAEAEYDPHNHIEGPGHDHGIGRSAPIQALPA